VDEVGQEVGRWILPYHDADVLHKVDYIPQETLFWRRELWQRIGARFDSDLQFAMDWDLILRFIHANAEFQYVPGLFGVFRIHQKQKTQASFFVDGTKEMNLIRGRYVNKAIGFYKGYFKHLLYLREHRRADKNFALGSGAR
jgi:hypothetical protein